MDEDSADRNLGNADLQTYLSFVCEPLCFSGLFPLQGVDIDPKVFLSGQELHCSVSQAHWVSGKHRCRGKTALVFISGTVEGEQWIENSPYILLQWGMGGPG